MVPQDTIDKAYQAHYQEAFNVTHVKVPGRGWIIIQRSCENCEFFRTDKTKYCFSPASGGCWQFKYDNKNGGDHESVTG